MERQLNNRTISYIGLMNINRSMEAQDQNLSLLFQTTTAANFMNVKTLLDELCKFVKLK